MGYLDRQSRVVDFVLTERGRKLYASGRLDFAYFAAFDDGIDYDPYSSGTLSESDRQTQIEALPMLEAPYIRDVRDTAAPLEPTSFVFHAVPGYNTVPQMVSPQEGDQVDLTGDQRRTPLGYKRSGTTIAQITPQLVGGVERQNPGFSIRVFASSSAGLQELDPRRDTDGRRVYDPFLAVSVDSEMPLDVPVTGSPASVRMATAAFVKR